jgi:hypothetical protein
MSHFAKVVDGIVVQVIVAEPEFFNTFVDTSPGTWVQTSYNTRGGIHYSPDTNTPDGGIALRKNYAGIGYTYDSIRDAFIAPKPNDDWLLDENSCLWYDPAFPPEQQVTTVTQTDTIAMTSLTDTIVLTSLTDTIQVTLTDTIQVTLTDTIVTGSFTDTIQVGITGGETLTDIIAQPSIGDTIQVGTTGA